MATASKNSVKSTKAATSVKSTKANINEAVPEVRERRVIVYQGPKHSTIKLKKNALYDILGIQPNATEDDIKKAYRRKALQLHPDKNLGEQDKDGRKKEMLGQVTRAYNVLSDPTKRKIYDKYGIEAVQTFEEHEIPPSWLWFVYSRVGRVVSCLAFLLTGCCFCLCCCLCCCCCCNKCGRGKHHSDDEDDGYMEYAAPREDRPPPPPPKATLASVINSISSKKFKKKKKQPQASNETIIPMANGTAEGSAVKIEQPLKSPPKEPTVQSGAKEPMMQSGSKVQSVKNQHVIYTQSTQE